MQARFVQNGVALDYTPGSDVSAGDVIVINNVVYVAKLDIESGVLGALHSEGVFEVAKVASQAWADGDPIYWDPTGDPNGGTADSGAATNAPNATATSYYMGRAVGAAGANDETGYVKLAGAFGPPRIAATTVAAAGSAQGDAAQLIEGFNYVTGPDDAKGVKLPAAAAGMVVKIKVGPGADLKVYPATGNTINGGSANAAITVVDDVCFELIALNGTDWYTLPLVPS